METYQIILWAMGIILLAAVVSYALRKGYNVTLKRKGLEASFEKPEEDASHARIRVAEGMVIKGSKVGDITGVKSSGGQPPSTDASVDVLKNASIEDSEISDISGIKNKS